MQKVVSIQGIINGVQPVTKVLARESILGIRFKTGGFLKKLKALKVVTIAQRVWNAVLSANPLVKLALLISAVVGGLIWLGKNVKSVGDFFGDLWDSIKVIIGPVLEFFGIWDKGTADHLKNERALEAKRQERGNAAATRNNKQLADFKD